MKILYSFLALLILLVKGFAGWENFTDKLNGKKVVIRGKKWVLVEKEVGFTVKRPQLFKFEIRSQRMYSELAHVRILRDREIYRKFKFSGRLRERLFLTPGRYTLKVSTPVLLRIFVYKKEHLRPVTPLGGGYINVLELEGRKFKYYRLFKDTVLRYRLKGPCKLKINIRSFLPEKETVKVLLRLDGKTIKTLQLKKVKLSRRAHLVGKEGVKVSKARVIYLKLPKGMHQLEIQALKSPVLVKVYRVMKRKKKRKKHKTYLQKKEELLRH